MGLNVGAVGTTAQPVERSWDSKDALLYALGVGAGSLDPVGFELDLTTENSDGITQRVLPTFATVVGQGGRAGISLGDYDPAMLVHAEQSIRLHGPIPVDGTVSATTKVAGMYDKGSAGLVVLESEARHAATGDPAFTLRTALFIRGEGGFGGPRSPEGDEETELASEPLPTREPDETVTYATRPRPGAPLPPQRRPQPVALGPDVRQARRVRPSDPPRAVHLRLHRPRPVAFGLRLRPGALRDDAIPVLQADHAGRHPDDLGVGHRRPVGRGLPIPYGDAAGGDGHRRRAVHSGGLTSL